MANFDVIQSDLALQEQVHLNDVSNIWLTHLELRQRVKNECRTHFFVYNLCVVYLLAFWSSTILKQLMTKIDMLIIQNKGKH